MLSHPQPQLVIHAGHVWFMCTPSKMLTPWHPMVKSGFGTQHLRLVPFTADKIQAEPGALRFPMTMNPDFTCVPNCLVCMSAGARGRFDGDTRQRGGIGVDGGATRKEGGCC